MSSAIEVHPGALATEARLLEILAGLRDEARADPTVLAQPVRVLVPSRSLRLHVCERIASELGAVCGIVVQTLHGAAVEILDRAGEEEGGADLLVEVLARRLARDERALEEAFADFVDGYGTVAGTVRDLLDAGFEAGHEEAALERVGEARLPRDEGRRAEAVVKTAARVAAALEARGRGGRAALLRLAREAFEDDSDRALPVRLVVVHGFADATGRASDLLEAVARRVRTIALIDHPSDPDDASRADLGCAYTDRLVERLEGVLGTASVAGRAGSTVPGTPPSPIRTAHENRSDSSIGDRSEPGTALPALFRAPGAEAEAREVARRIRILIADGVRPERIGVVARDLGAHTVALRRHLDRLGVPASALRARAPIDGAGRALVALVELFEEKDRIPADRWLDATRRLVFDKDGEEVRRGASDALRLALRVAGAGRLDEAAELDPAVHLEKGKMPLPVRVAVSTGEADDKGPGIGFHARRAKVPGYELHGAVKAAKALRRRLARWPKRASLAKHLAELERLRTKDLGWRAGDRAEQRARGVLEELADVLGSEEVTTEELALLLRRVLVPVARPPFCDGAPGAGGGVAVLDAMEARARTFDHLFLIGLNQGEFPRVVREDPLFGEEARRALADLLPDVPLPSRGRAEDRYLFAQLLSSSPNVAISWQVSGDDGKARVVSPLVERLLGEESADTVLAAPPVFPGDLDAARNGGPRTAREHAVLGGLHAGRAGHVERLALALAEMPDANGVTDTSALAITRSRVLDAHDDAFRDPAKLAPWLGFLGSQDADAIRPDPRSKPLYVTRYEALARCPWQAVLSRLLRLEQTPDPLDALPGFDPRLIGNVVHAVIERVVRQAVGDEDRSFSQALAREPVPIAWPDDEALLALALDVTRGVIVRTRKPAPGLVRTVVECAWPSLLRARAFDLGEAERFDGHGVLGAEVTGRARVDLGNGEELELLFRADRIEARGGKVCVTDFKAGAPKTSKDVKKSIPRGENLQPLVYAIAAHAAGTDARGRFLFLKSEDETEVAFDERFGEHVADLASALGTTSAAWREGAFFPRLVRADGEKEPDACRMCDVSQACLRGDSGARRALVAIAGGEADVGKAGSALTSLFALEALGKGRGR